jgi:uncharacterized integral membrane protein
MNIDWFRVKTAIGLASLLFVIVVTCGVLSTCIVGWLTGQWMWWPLIIFSLLAVVYGAFMGYCCAR